MCSHDARGDGMDWVGSLLSVTTTIGRIAGVLVDELAVAHVGPLGGGVEPELGQVVFYRDGNAIRVLNQAKKEGVSLFFPDDDAGKNGALTIFLPPLLPKRNAKDEPVGLNIAPAFIAYSAAGVDEFLITTNPVPPTASDDDGISVDPEPIQLQVSREQELKPSHFEMQIGPFFKVQIKNATQATMQIGMVGGLMLAAISLIRFRAGGRSTFTLLNPWRRSGAADDAGGSPDLVDIELPEGADVSGGITNLEIIAQGFPSPDMMEDWMKENAGLFSPLTEKHRQVLAAAAARR